MNIIYINTSNKGIAKDRLIKGTIKAGMQYIEMEDELLIDGNYLVRFLEKKLAFMDENLVSFREENINCFFADEVNFKDISLPLSFSKIKKSDYKRESKKVNGLVKTKQYSNIRRRYK